MQLFFCYISLFPILHSFEVSFKMNFVHHIFIKKNKSNASSTVFGHCGGEFFLLIDWLTVKNWCCSLLPSSSSGFFPWWNVPSLYILFNYNVVRDVMVDLPMTRMQVPASSDRGSSTSGSSLISFCTLDDIFLQWRGLIFYVCVFIVVWLNVLL